MGTTLYNTPALKAGTNVNQLNASGINQGINQIQQVLNQAKQNEKYNEVKQENELAQQKQIVDKANKVKLMTNLESQIDKYKTVTDNDTPETIKEKSNKIKQLLLQATDVANQYGLTNTASSLLQDSDKLYNSYKDQLYKKYATNLASSNINKIFNPNDISNQTDDYQKYNQVMKQADTIKDPTLKTYYLQAANNLLASDKDSIVDAKKKEIQMANDIRTQEKQNQINDQIGLVDDTVKDPSKLPSSFPKFVELLRKRNVNVAKLMPYIKTAYSSAISSIDINNKKKQIIQDANFKKNLNSINTNSTSVTDGSHLVTLNNSFKVVQKNGKQLVTAVGSVDNNMSTQLGNTLNTLDTLIQQLNKAKDNNVPQNDLDNLKQNIKDTWNKYTKLKQQSLDLLNNKVKPINTNGSLIDTNNAIDLFEWKLNNTSDPKEKQAYTHLMNMIKSGYLTDINENKLGYYKESFIFKTHNNLFSKNNLPSTKQALLVFYAMNGGNDANTAKQIKLAQNSTQLNNILKKNKVLSKLIETNNQTGAKQIDRYMLQDSVEKAFGKSNKIDVNNGVKDEINNIGSDVNNININNKNIDVLNIDKFKPDVLKNKPEYNEVITRKIMFSKNNMNILAQIKSGDISTNQGMYLFSKAYKNQKNFKYIKPYINQEIKALKDVNEISIKAKDLQIFKTSESGVLYLPKVGIPSDKLIQAANKLAITRQTGIKNINDLMSNKKFQNIFMKMYNTNLANIKPNNKAVYYERLPLTSKTYTQYTNMLYKILMKAQKEYNKEK